MAQQPQANQRAQRPAQQGQRDYTPSHISLVLSTMMATGTVVVVRPDDDPKVLALRSAPGKKASKELIRLLDAHRAGIHELLSPPQAWTERVIIQSS
jgi:hypothetical protein